MNTRHSRRISRKTAEQLLDGAAGRGQGTPAATPAPPGAPSPGSTPVPARSSVTPDGTAEPAAPITRTMMGQVAARMRPKCEISV